MNIYLLKRKPVGKLDNDTAVVFLLLNMLKEEEQKWIYYDVLVKKVIKALAKNLLPHI